MKKIGFDNEKYLAEQTRFILERAENGGEKLYIECGGKLLHDFHAARVLPGYDPDVKMRVFFFLFRSLFSPCWLEWCIYTQLLAKFGNLLVSIR